jgi:hypothetical protein
MFHFTDSLLVSEVIALKLRRPNTTRPYLHPQIFAGLSYIIASAFMLALWYVQRRKKPDVLV